MTFPNGVGYFDYEDVPSQLYEKNTINIDDDILLESESMEQGRYDHLSHTDRRYNKSSIQTDGNS